MEEFEKEKKENKVPGIKIFPIPFAMEEIKKTTTITTKSPSELSKEQIINQAFKFHSQGEIKKAAKYYQQFINEGFTDHRVFSNYGVILKDLGNLEEAELSQRKAIDLNPDNAMAHSNLGNILKDLGNLKEAELSQRKAIEINPNYANAHYNLGIILKDLGNLKEAEFSTRKAIDLNPDNAMAHSHLGNILKDLGNLQEAELSQRKAIELNPNYANAHYNLGIILIDLGKFQRSNKNSYQEAGESSYRKAIELNPNFADAHYCLGKSLLQRGKHSLSLKYFSKSAELLRGYNNQKTNHKRFTIISKAKIKHDIEQFEYLVSQGYQIKKFTDLAILYKKIATEINWPSETKLIYLNNKYKNLLKDNYNRLIHRIEAPRITKDAINNCLNFEKITNDYLEHDFGLTYIDNFLSKTALESLKKFLLGTTIWFDIKSGGYLGAYLKEGLANPLIIQIAEELQKKLPRIFQKHQIKQIWAYKYDSRAKNKNSLLKGIKVHADQAAVNVNFWISPKEANLNPYSGGLIVYDVEAPNDWDFNSYNNDEKKIREELKKSKGNTRVIPHNENRAVVFNSNLFHETDSYEFKEGYENRRINVTMLFGDRRNS
tara:strand:- start:698 stop:2503 length:1806 start_codon:yes stop_codon:yes gene_type:complete